MASFGFRPLQKNIIDEMDILADEYIMFIYLNDEVPNTNAFLHYYYQKKDIVLFENKPYDSNRIIRDFLIIMKTAKQRLQNGMYEDIYCHDVSLEIILKIQHEMEQRKTNTE